VVFGDVWRRADLSLRERCLVTIVALAAMGHDDQLEFYLRLGIESGLTRLQITEAITHLGFYAGWGRATGAMAAGARTFGYRHLSSSPGRL
jgi:4-carboxymuconolactone decarboxylase